MNFRDVDEVFRIKKFIFFQSEVLRILFSALLLRIPPEKLSLEEAVLFMRPNHFRDSWKLAEKFVVAEGMHIIPRINNSK